MIAVLTQRRFGFLWVGGLISLLGDQVLSTALPFFVYRLTGSVFDTGTITIAYFLPAVLFGSVAGVFIDRWNIKRTMIVANVAQALVLLPLLLVSAPDRVWIVYPLALALSTLSLFVGPATAVVLPRLVGGDHLVHANSLNSINGNAARLIGPPLGGALLAWTGLSIVTFVDSASFLAAAALVSLVTLPSIPSSATADLAATAFARWTSRWRDWLEGLRLIWHQRLLRIVFVVGGIATVADAMLGPLLVPFVRNFLHGNAVTYGWISVATGIGGLLGAMLLGRPAKRLGSVQMIVAGLVFVGLFAVIRYNVVTLPVALLTFWGGGVGAAIWNVGRTTLLQTETPDAYRGRVFGASSTTTALTLLSGTALATLLGDRLGILPLLELSASLYLAAGILLFGLSSRSFTQVVYQRGAGTHVHRDR